MHLSSHTFKEELINIPSSKAVNAYPTVYVMIHHLKHFQLFQEKHDMNLLVETCFYTLHVKELR